MKTKITLLNIACGISAFLQAQENKIIQPTQPASIIVNVQNVEMSCFSPCTGAATIVLSGGTAPFSYTLAGPSYTTGTTSSNTIILNNLCPSSYGFYVCDNSFINCSVATFTINTISYPVITSHAYGPAGGPNPPFLYNATVTINGGAPPYYTQWSLLYGGIVTSHTISTSSDTAYLYPGDYMVFVTDSTNAVNGCTGNPVIAYTLSICDNSGMLPPGGILISPNDTLCSNATFTVDFYTGPWCLYAMYFSDNPSCDPSFNNSCLLSYTCTANQTTVFSGYWNYSFNCPSVPIPSNTLVVQTCTGMDDKIQSTYFNIKPNPNNGIFEIYNNNLDDALIEIIDITGKLMYSEKTLNKTQFNIDLPAGMYYVRVKTTDAIHQEKLLIMK